MTEHFLVQNSAEQYYQTGASRGKRVQAVCCFAPQALAPPRSTLSPPPDAQHHRYGSKV